MKLAVFVYLSLLACALPAEPIGGDNLAEDRKQFAEAYSALRSKQSQKAFELIKGLENYPLYPYFRYLDLSRRLHRRPTAQVREFLAAYDESLLADRLRGEWLSFLARTKQWSEFLHDYRPLANTKLKCAQLTARIETGTLEGVLENARALWLVGKSQPDECDPAFARLKSSKLMDDQLIWQRIRLAFDNNKPSLARYLARGLGSSELRKSAEIWATAHADPIRSLKSPLLKQDNPVTREIVVHALQRLARKNIDKAVAIWQEYGKRYQFGAHESGAVLRAIAIAAARKNHPNRVALLDQVPAVAIDDVVEKRRIRAALEENAWTELVRWTADAPTGTTDILRWRYWRGRALQSLERIDAAKLIFRELAKQRDYYGFLSADQLGYEYRMNDQRIAPSEVEIANILARPGIRRARELYLLDMPFKARREWRHEVEQLSPRQFEVAAVVVHSWGWYDRAILALGKAQAYDDLEIRFPLLHDDLVAKFAAKRGLDRSVLYSIIRTESAFMTDARSPAGALGLMQLMPATGRETARRIGTKLSNARALLAPAKNITIGSAYLKQMLSRFGGSFSLAAAAYNAGPHRVRTWLPKSGCVPADIWIDTIPFTETRRYVRRASFYATVYQWRLNEKIQPLTSRLTDVAPIGTNQQC